MNCKECVALLEQYHDCELSQEVIRTVESHLKDCNQCLTALDELAAESAAYQQYASQIEVPAHLWEHVRVQLDRPRVADRPAAHSSLSFFNRFLVPRVSMPVAMALALVAVLATALVMRRLGGPSTKSVASSERADQIPALGNDMSRFEVSKPETPPKEIRKPITSARAPSRTPKTVTPETLVREAQKKYIAAIDALSRDVQRKRPQLDSETRLKLEQALASIDRTIQTTRRVVREHPNDAIAVQYMFAAYSKKVDVLREIAARRSL